MRPIPLAFALAVVAAPAFAAPAPAVLLAKLAADVKPEELRATDTRLVAFGTRHTLSDTASETRGIGAALGEGAIRGHR